MADSKISALTASTTPLAGSEVLPIVQSSTTKQVSVANLTAGRAVTAASVTTTGEVKASGGLRVTGSYAANAANQVAFQNSAGVGAMYVNGATTGIGNLGTFVMWQQDSTGGNYLQTLGVDVTANVTVTSGNLVIGTSGKGIDFSITSSGSGTMTSELLADYEEGTWTPVFSVGGITGTSITYSGTYTKVGRAVTVNFVATSGSGNINVASYVGFTGLPFSTSATFSGSVTSEDIDIFASLGFCSLAGTTFYLSKCGNGTSANLYGTCTYFV